MKKTFELCEKKIHPIGIGTWDMGGARFEDNTIYAEYEKDEKNIAAVRYSLSKGQDHIDTAQLYGAGHTEELVGEAIAGFSREKLFLATKVWQSHTLRHSVVPALKESLRKMGTSYVDLLYIHFPFTYASMEEYIPGLNDALETGMAKNIGVSNFNLEQLKKAKGISRNPIRVIQIHYNLLHRETLPEELERYCLGEGISIVAYRPLERRLLADNCRHPKVLSVAEKHKCPPSQVALRWLIAKGIVPIPKASLPKHIDENLEVLGINLDSEDMENLDAIIAREDSQ